MASGNPALSGRFKANEPALQAGIRGGTIVPKPPTVNGGPSSGREKPLACKAGSFLAVNRPYRPDSCFPRAPGPPLAAPTPTRADGTGPSGRKNLRSGIHRGEPVMRTMTYSTSKDRCSTRPKVARSELVQMYISSESGGVKFISDDPALRFFQAGCSKEPIPPSRPSPGIAASGCHIGIPAGGSIVPNSSKVGAPTRLEE